MAPAMQANATDADAPPKPNPTPPLAQQLFLKEAKAHVDAAIGSDIGFVERLVWFWSNHFCVNADATVEAGGYEREAIRANVLGRFADMLLAAEGHPAMLIYLDNAQSIGPNSVAGINRNRGLNENLAREILELHTLGVRTVYTQTDVTNFAKVLTGWTIIPTVSNPDHGGEFVFNKRMHEPGPQTVVGKTYPDTGVEQGARGARRSRAPSGDREARRDQAGAPLHRRRAAAAAGRDADAALPRHRRRSQGDGEGARHRPGILVAGAGQAQASGRMDDRDAARRGIQGRHRAHHAHDGACSANRCGGRRRRRDSPTTTRRGWTAWRSGSTSPMPFRSASPRGSIRRS